MVSSCERIEGKLLSGVLTGELGVGLEVGEGVITTSTGIVGLQKMMSLTITKR